MKIENHIKRLGNRIAVTVALLSVLLVSSCKKDMIDPDKSQVKITPLAKLDTTHHSTSIFKSIAPISLNGIHDITISGDSINGGQAVCINLTDCYNIHITKSKLMNSSNSGISLTNCKNIVLDSCYVANVSIGVYTFNSDGVQVKNNKFKNMSGSPKGITVEFHNWYKNGKEGVDNITLNNETAD